MAMTGPGIPFAACPIIPGTFDSVAQRPALAGRYDYRLPIPQYIAHSWAGGDDEALAGDHGLEVDGNSGLGSRLAGWRRIADKIMSAGGAAPDRGAASRVL